MVEWQKFPKKRYSELNREQQVRVDEVSEELTESQYEQFRHFMEKGWTIRNALKKVDKSSDWTDKAQRELEEKLDVKTERMNYSFYEDMYNVDVFAVEAVNGKGNNGEREWLVFKTYDDARKAAINKVEHDLEDQPELFNDSFIQKHLYINDTDKRMILSDEEHHIRTMLKEDGLEGEKLEEKLQERLDRMEEGMEDPIQYFVRDRGIYDKSTLMDQGFIRIDIEEAAEEAVSTDGVGHFLDVYDFAAVELPSGAYAYGVN